MKLEPTQKIFILKKFNPSLTILILLLNHLWSKKEKLVVMVHFNIDEVKQKIKEMREDLRDKMILFGVFWIYFAVPIRHLKDNWHIILTTPEVS